MLSAYSSVLIMIEKSLKDIDVEKLIHNILAMEADTEKIKSRYFHLESRLNTIVEVMK